MSIQQAYTQWSETYDSDRNRTRDLDQEVTHQTLANIQCQSILELGCGTGKNTVFLAEIGERVLALDFSEGMLSKAKEKVTSNNVTFEVADLTKPWPSKDHSVELISCNLVLEHIADLDFIFSEAARSLVSGGHFFISELHPFRQYQGTLANFQRGEEKTEIPAFVHHVSDFVRASHASGFTLELLNEWWHAEDENKPPRLITFLFKK
ncbi:MAG TPA: class I SAM-dependent methyltransferase [Blastocatellia bacterium]|nr:class I SAM-dependent methyltransferase [Blastocatellia bacterium]